MVTVRNSEHLLRRVSLLSLVWWPEPNVRDYRGISIYDTWKNHVDIPESMATMVKISLLQLNSRLAMSIFAI